MFQLLVDSATSVALTDPQAIENPFDGVVPLFDFLGSAFREKWQVLLGWLWGILLVLAAAALLIALGSLKDAKNSSNPQKMSAARDKVIGSAVSLGSLAIAPLIVGGILLIAS